MTLERGSAGTSLVDVLDRVLDKGIVIDAYVRVTLVGIDLIGVEARIVVASVDTYLRYADQIALAAPAARHMVSDRSDEMDQLLSENRDLKRQLKAREAGSG